MSSWKDAYQTGDAQTFNESVEKIRAEISKRAEADISTIAFEKTYNGYEPFYRSSIGYLWIFLIACVSWLISAYLKPGQAQSGAAKALLNCAYLLTGLVLIAHTFGLAGRMYIEGRPPVTNLYSSALFISWGAVVLCFLTEKFSKAWYCIGHGIADRVWRIGGRTQPEHRFLAQSIR